MKKKVLLGMSGGVDSSVSAILLQEAGYEVIGATMKLWKEENPNGLCGSDSSVNDAKKVCDKLGIKHYVFNFEKEFNDCVINDFISCYNKAQTPNPCVMCNKHLKFGYLYKKALELGCEYIATGHYARAEYDEEYKEYVLKKSSAENKDQTYFLYNISKDIISKAIFPLQSFVEKKDIRKIAKDHGLELSEKKDSQEICFISDNDYTKFLLKSSKDEVKQGNIVSTNGEILGKHKGLIYYTIGQRKGLGLTYKEPLYVVKLDLEKNEVIVGTERELYSKELYATNLNFLLLDRPKEKMKVKAKIRYRSKEADALIIPINNDKVKIEFEEKQRAITPGQSVVFYIKDVVIGGGIII